MNKYFATLAITLLCSLYTLAQNFPIGSITATLTDASRNNRSIPVEIYYPSGTTAGANRPVASGNFPVLVIGHGFSMGVDAYENFWNFFVPKGFIIILPNTEIGPIPFPDHAALGADLNFCVNYMQAQNTVGNSPFFGKVKNKTAVFGHSMGGGCSFLAAETGNPNITTLLGVAPAETNTSAIDAAANISIPALLFAGGNDRVTPPADNVGAMYNALQSSCKNIVTIANASHCGFAESNFACNFGEGSSCIGCTFIPRATQHSITFQFMEPWLNFFLKEQCSEWTTFENRFATVQGVTSQRSCNYSLPDVSAVAQGNTSFCDGNSLDINATGTYNNYTWNNGITTQNIAVNQSGDYSVIVTDQYNCKDTSNIISVTVNPNPTPEISGGATISVCNATDLELSLNATYDSYAWNTNESSSSITVNTNGTYEVSVTDNNGCSGSTTTNVRFNSINAPTINITGTTTLCLGETATLVVSGNYTTYNWSNGATTATIDITNSDNYILTVTDASGCSATSQINIQFLQTPAEPEILQNNNTLSVNSTDNVSWFLNNTLVSTGNTFQPTENGQYVAIVTNSDGCSSTSEPYNFVITSINKYSFNNLTVYPNPADNFITINAKEGIVNLNIIDVTGKILHAKKSASDKELLNISFLINGVYLIKAEYNNGETEYIKLMVK